MTHIPAASQAWPRAGAAPRATASGEQVGDGPEPRASELPPGTGEPPTLTPKPTTIFPDEKPEDGAASQRPTRGDSSERG